MARTSNAEMMRYGFEAIEKRQKQIALDAGLTELEFEEIRPAGIAEAFIGIGAAFDALPHCPTCGYVNCIWGCPDYNSHQ